eukprot:TRINITY_DN3313_c0_g1_i1.p1 TRINITY_DN3313_c0_g1~~TRINITY_DN3313_c0_g1_i1.p1  ORF type:complete len:236 (+),score=48.06 TRINITY_DN3313_c0_g1_i1:103-708(+)
MLINIANEKNLAEPLRSQVIQAHANYKDSWNRFKEDSSYLEDQYWRDFIQDAGLQDVIDYPLETLKLMLRESIDGFDYVIETVRKLTQKGVRVCILSNHSQPWADAIARKFGLYEIFDKDLIIISCDVRCSKPSEQIYRVLLEKIDRDAGREVDRSRVMFLDDKKENVNAARMLGIDAVEFMAQDQSQEELNQIFGSRGIL